MNRVACWTTPVWITICILVMVARAPGQNLDAADMFYSHGVHAYFGDKAREAEQ